MLEAPGVARTGAVLLLLAGLALMPTVQAQAPADPPPGTANSAPSDDDVAAVEGPPSPDAGSRIELSLTAAEATVGELVSATLTVELDSDTLLDPPNLGPALGPFNVSGGTWSGPERVVDPNTGTAKRLRWTWTGNLSAFRTGEQEVPAVTLSVRRGEATLSLSTEPVAITIKSVLDPEELADGDPELADLKPPASVAPDYGPLKAAVGVLILLLVGSLVAWWLHRRFAERFAAAAVPEDPFHRTPPHIWVYGELQKLLERRLPEGGHIEQFYSELSHILKRYLSGRYRVELLERTTEEVPGALAQAGAPRESIHDTEDLLRESDGVKFAKQRPEPSEWKAAVERVYRIVDRTKPVDVEPESDERGAA